MAAKKIPPPNPKDLGMLCSMAIGLAGETARELQMTGKVGNVKVARTRMRLLVGSADAILKHLRTEKAEV